MHVKCIENGFIEIWTEVFTIILAMPGAEYRDDCLYNLIGCVSELCTIGFTCMFVIEAPMLLEMIFN